MKASYKIDSAIIESAECTVRDYSRGLLSIPDTLHLLCRLYDAFPIQTENAEGWQAMDAARRRFYARYLLQFVAEIKKNARH